jgi:hypothetical protein
MAFLIPDPVKGLSIRRLSISFTVRWCPAPTISLGFAYSSRCWTSTSLPQIVSFSEIPSVDLSVPFSGDPRPFVVSKGLGGPGWGPKGPVSRLVRPSQTNTLLGDTRTIPSFRIPLSEDQLAQDLTVGNPDLCCALSGPWWTKSTYSCPACTCAASQGLQH